jgi:hypothetical protein
MIPASYLFKTVYDQAWTEPAPETTAQPEPPVKGTLSPLRDWLLATFRRHTAPSGQMPSPSALRITTLWTRQPSPGSSASWYTAS